MEAGTPPASLWPHRGFRLLWLGESISLLGSQVTQLALPLAAVLALGASSAEMGMLSATQTLAFLLVGLLAGAWVDRLPRRPILIWADLARAVLLASIPLAALAGQLHLAQLYAVAFLTAIATVFYSTAHASFLPNLVDRTLLTDANSKLALSLSAARIAGPGLAGLLVQALTAPVAILVDAASFLLSAACVARVRFDEPTPEAAERPGLWREIGEGVRIVLRQPVLRAISLSVAVSNGADGLMSAVFLLYLVQELGLDPVALGGVLAMAGPGTLVGSLLTGRLPRRLGPGPTLIVASAVLLAAVALRPLAAGPPALSVALLGAGTFLAGVGNPLFNVTSLSLRQATTPDRRLGRVSATTGLVGLSVMPLGAVLGGFLGDAVGLRATLAIGVLGYVVLGLGLVLSPVRRAGPGTLTGHGAPPPGSAPVLPSAEAGEN